VLLSKKVNTFMPQVACLYWLPHCSTCQKAEAALQDLGVTIERTIDLKATPITANDLRTLVTGIGGEEALFSKRAMKYRSMGLHEQVLTPEQLFEHMLTEYTFIKRPVLLTTDNQVIAGFSQKTYNTLFKKP
jgi:arsenate reductase (glutaredoxin)